MSTEHKPVAMNQWMVSDGGQQQGPFAADEVKQMIAEGRLSPVGLVWTPGMPEWKLWQQTLEFGPLEPEVAKSPTEAKPATKPATKAAAWRAGWSTDDWRSLAFFERLFTPQIIHAAYWLGLGVGLVMFLISLASAISALFWANFLYALFGACMSVVGLIAWLLVLRIVCELVILLFRIGETLGEIRQDLKPPPAEPHSVEPAEDA